LKPVADICNPLFAHACDVTGTVVVRMITVSWVWWCKVFVIEQEFSLRMALNPTRAGLNAADV
jgi:hypothetical protein